VQGPRAAALVQRLTPLELARLGTYRFSEGSVAGVPCIVSRTGYTGEDGFELYCAPAHAQRLWDALLEEGQAQGIKPCGLGARDSLRTEMKYALYGNDIDETHTALEAGLGWVVKLDKPAFVGKEALAAQKAAGVPRKLVGFELTGPGVPRHGYPVLHGGQRVGEVTSGTLGPSVRKAIGMAYVPTALSTEGSTFEVEIRGRAVPARVVKTPFWKKTDAQQS
jgi:aminomethyltransferase